MPARKVRLKLDTEWRAKIQTSMIVNRLQDFAVGKKGVEMSRGQVAAAIALLKKTIPDLSSVDLGNKDGQALNITIRRFGDGPGPPE